MDPVTMLVQTLALGATAALKDTAGEAVKDAYKALKTEIVTKFGPQPTVEALERTPTSATKRAAAAEDLIPAASDQAVGQRVRELAEIVQRDDPQVGQVVGVSIKQLISDLLEIDTVRSSGSGTEIVDSKITKVSIKKVTAGVGSGHGRP